MLKISLRSNPNRCRRRCRVYPGQKVSKKYRQAVVRRTEYKKLQRLIPTIAKRRRVPELTVILEAVKYIDELHSAIADRVRTFQSRQLLFEDRKRPEGSDVTRHTATQVELLPGERLSKHSPDCTTVCSSKSLPVAALAAHLIHRKFVQLPVIKGTSTTTPEISTERHSVTFPNDSFQMLVRQRHQLKDISTSIKSVELPPKCTG